MQKKFETKTVMVGEDDDLAKEARVLNPIVRWHSRKGITYEIDPSVHAEIMQLVKHVERDLLLSGARRGNMLNELHYLSVHTGMQAGRRRWRHVEFRRGDETQTDQERTFWHNLGWTPHSPRREQQAGIWHSKT